MNALTRRARADLWWIVPLAILALLIAWETGWGGAVRMTPPTEAPVAPRPVVTALLPEYAIAGGVAARSETTARTLFNPTRRPAATLAADAARTRMQRGQFALTGTTVIDGKSTAFLRETAGGKSRRVRQGETINGLVVADVKVDRVRLALGDESEELVLRVAANPRPTAQPVAPVAAPAPVPATAGSAPAAPPVAAAPGQPAPQPIVPGDPAQSLAQRRAAARAAAAAAQPPVSGAAPSAAPAAAAPSADPGWQEMYRRYQSPVVPLTNR